MPPDCANVGLTVGATGMDAAPAFYLRAFNEGYGARPLATFSSAVTNGLPCKWMIGKMFVTDSLWAQFLLCSASCPSMPRCRGPFVPFVNGG